MGPDPGEQFFLGGGFDDVILGTGGKAGNDVLLVVAGGDEQDGNVGGARRRLDDPAGIQTGHAGHIDIEQNQVRQVTLKDGQGARTAVGLDHSIAGPGEHGVQQPDGHRIVIDDQDARVGVLVVFSHGQIMEEKSGKVKGQKGLRMHSSKRPTSSAPRIG